MKKITALLLSVCATQMAWAQTAQNTDAEAKKTEKIVDKEAQDILKKVDATVKKIQTVQYDSAATGIGSFAARRANVSGKVIQHGIDSNPMAKFYFDGTVTRPGSSESRRLIAGTDGDLSFLVDFSTKMAHEDIDPAVMGSDGRTAGSAFMLEFTHNRPFSDEINADKIEMLGAESVAGVDCYKIRVKYAGQPQESTWYFGKKDFLPRRVDRNYPSQNGGTSIIVSNLKTDPKLGTDAFQLKLPEGFEKTDEFAPMRRPPTPVAR